MDADRRRCSTCRKWSPNAGAKPARGTCADPTVIARPDNAGVAGMGSVRRTTRLTIVTTAADAVCPRWAPLPVRFR